MWLVLRNKRSHNNILKKFETKDQYHEVKVNDIIKFGRVNFKVSIIKSDKVNKNIQGGYHLLEEKNAAISKTIESMYNKQTELQTAEREKKKQERINRRNRKLNLSKVTDEFNIDIATPNMTQIGIRNENNQNFNVLDAGNPNPLSNNNNDRTLAMIGN